MNGSPWKVVNMNLDALVNEYDKKQMLEVEMQSRLGRRICKRVILRSWPPLALDQKI